LTGVRLSYTTTVTASLLARLANARFLGEDEGRGEEKGKAQLCERRHCCARDRLSGVKMCPGYRYRWYSYRSDVIYGCGEDLEDRSSRSKMPTPTRAYEYVGGWIGSSAARPHLPSDSQLYDRHLE